MRKIIEDSLNAFIEGRQFNRSNMLVTFTTVGIPGEPGIVMYQHGNAIAWRPLSMGAEGVTFSNCDWYSATTKERLNALIRHYTNGRWWLASDRGEWVLYSAHHGEHKPYNGGPYDIVTLLELDRTIADEKHERRAA